MKKACWAIYTLLAIGFLMACGNEASKDESTSTAPAEQEEQAARVVEVTLSFVEPRFRPDPIEIKVGEPIRFKVSSDDTRHRFVIEPFGINVEVPQKALNEPVVTKVVTPAETGTFRMFCSTHARMPMEGKLVVVEANQQ